MKLKGEVPNVNDEASTFTLPVRVEEPQYAGNPYWLHSASPIMDDSTVVCEVWGRENAERIGRVVNSIPALVEAAEAAIVQLKSHLCDCESAFAEQQIKAVVDQLRAALEAAKGR